MSVAAARSALRRRTWRRPSWRLWLRRLGLVALPLIGVGFLWQLAYATFQAAWWGDDHALVRLLEPRCGTGIGNCLSDIVYPLRQVITLFDVPGIRFNALVASIAVGACAFAGLVVLAGRRRSRPLGNARFARLGDLSRAGLLRPTGRIFGKLDGEVLRADDELHQAIVGPTRSGKGAGFIAPTCLSWEGSLLAFDVKAEAFKWSAATRAVRGNKVFVFDPLKPRTDRFNPLDFIRPLGERGYSDVTRYANLLVPPSKEAVWSQNARLFLAGLIAYVLESERYEGRRNLAEVYRLVMNEHDPAELYQGILEREDLSDFVHSRVGAIANMTSEKTREGYIGNVRAALEPYGNPTLAAAISASDFDVRELRREPTSIYITCTADELPQLAPLIRLMIQITSDHLVRALPGTDEPHRVQILVDEFAEFGKMDELARQMPLMAGFGVNLSLIFQNLSQLDDIYGRHARNAIMGNAGRRLYLAFNDNETADYVSATCGITTVDVVDEQTSRHMGRITGRTRSVRQQTRPLLRPDECHTLPRDELILLQEGLHPVRGKKFFYFEDVGLKRLTETPLPHGVGPSELVPYPFTRRLPALVEPDSGNGSDDASSSPSTIVDYDETVGLAGPGDVASSNHSAYVPTDNIETSPRDVETPLARPAKTPTDPDDDAPRAHRPKPRLAALSSADAVSSATVRTPLKQTETKLAHASVAHDRVRRRSMTSSIATIRARMKETPSVQSSWSESVRRTQDSGKLGKLQDAFETLEGEAAGKAGMDEPTAPRITPKAGKGVRRRVSASMTRDAYAEASARTKRNAVALQQQALGRAIATIASEEAAKCSPEGAAAIAGQVDAAHRTAIEIASKRKNDGEAESEGRAA